MGEILCIIDGMTDPGFCVEDFQNLASMELLRRQDNVLGGEPETLNCVLHLLGVKHLPEHLRGYLEALGCGIPVSKDDLILRGSWYRLDERGRYTVPCGAPAKWKSPAFRYYHLGQYKSLLVLPHMAGLLDQIVTHLPSGSETRNAGELIPEGSKVLREVFLQGWEKNRFMALWGQSAPAELPPFPKRAAVVCGKGIVKGIAKALGMELVPVKNATGDTNTDLVGKAEAALEAAWEYPFTLLHINGADEASHRKNAREKRQFLEQVDKEVLSRLLASPHQITVVADHGTDPETGLHLGEKQPVFGRKEKG